MIITMRIKELRAAVKAVKKYADMANSQAKQGDIFSALEPLKEIRKILERAEV